MIPEPHGGRLVDRRLAEPRRTARLAEARELPRLVPSLDELLDLHQIGSGAYSPLEGFMGSADLASVLSEGRLTSGLVWSLPILLAPPGPENARVIGSLSPGDEVALTSSEGGPVALLRLTEKFPVDRRAIALGAFGTTDSAHPNVADLAGWGETALAGSVDLLEAPVPASPDLELDPAATRAAFRAKGWSSVAAYQCRNPPHTAHEYLQRLTLEREDVDGLFVQPVIGRLKKGDYRPQVILEAYRALLTNYYPSSRVMLGALPIAMRYAGPKAALFLALVRKNFGCSHYIVGRDQAGVGSYYGPYDAHRIFDRFDVGLTPLRYEETFHCRRCGGMATAKCCPHPASDRIDTSQSRIRRALAEGGTPPPELLRPEVAEILRRPGVLLDA